MIRHLLIVAIGFRLAGFVLGVASIATLVDLADTALMMRRTPPPEAGPALDISTYGLVALISNAMRGLALGVHALAGFLTIILVILAIGAVFALLLGIVLYLTGRGIGHHAMWARVSGIVLSIGLALVSCAIMAVMRRDHAAFAALPIGLSLYALWVMVWRFD